MNLVASWCFIVSGQRSVTADKIRLYWRVERLEESEEVRMKKADEAALEIYRQKYAVFRHLDALRWQIPTFTLGAGSLLLAFAAEPNKPPARWSFFVFAFLALFSSFAVYRVRKGIHKNHAALDAAARVVGDRNIPKPSRFGATWWLSVILVLAALTSLALGVLK